LSSRLKPSGGGCFPASALLELKNQSSVPIAKLQIGDEVLVGGGRYEPIMLFGHRDFFETSEMCVIEATDCSRLILTPNHCIPLADGRQLPARSIHLGHQLINSAGEIVVVCSTCVKPAQGTFQLKTPSSEVCVDGILCSTFNEPAKQLNGVPAPFHQLVAECCAKCTWRCIYRTLALTWRISKVLGLGCSHLLQAGLLWCQPHMFRSPPYAYLHTTIQSSALAIGKLSLWAVPCCLQNAAS